jgi:hypothetical protein
MSAMDDAWRRQVVKSWQDAVLSDMPEHSLVRYFNYQLELITKISDSQFNAPTPETHVNIQALLLALIDHLRVYYSCYFNTSADAPLAYCLRSAEQLSKWITLIRQGLLSPGVTPALRVVLYGWLQEMSKVGLQFTYSFRELQYFNSLVSKLSKMRFWSESAEEEIINCLILENFNHLSFFVFLQQRFLINEQQQKADLSLRLTDLRQHKLAVMSRPEAIGLSFDPAWPSLKTMLRAWLEEEITLSAQMIEDAVKTQTLTHQKIPVKIPVNHLAYLTRLFVEESTFGIQNLKVIFKFYADHIQTKRQPAISPGGFSKAYYSTDQQTAARVMALLQRMITRIKRDFFLVMVAVSTAALCCPGSH